MSEPTGARRYGTGGGDAYYDAVKYGGYQGTREQFGRDQAEFAENAAAVAEAKEVVEQDTEEVRSTKNTFVNITVPEAIQAVQQEGQTQVQAVTQQGEESSQQVEAVGTQWQDNVANEGRARVAAVQDEGGTQAQAVTDEGTHQIGLVEAAGAAQVQAVAAEGTTQIQAVQDKGEEVIESIPQDYTELVEDVEEIRNDVGYIDIPLGTSSASYFTGNPGSAISETPNNLSSSYIVDLSEFIGFPVLLNLTSTAVSSTRITALCSSDGVIKSKWLERDFANNVYSDGLTIYPDSINNKLYISFTTNGSSVRVGKLTGIISDVTDMKTKIFPSVVYVDGSVSTTGKGSSDSPFKTIAEGIASGALQVLVKAGTYDENITVANRKQPLAIMLWDMPQTYSTSVEDVPKIKLTGSGTNGNGVRINGCGEVYLSDIWAYHQPSHLFMLWNTKKATLVRCYATGTWTQNQESTTDATDQCGFSAKDGNMQFIGCKASNVQADGFNFHWYGNFNVVDCIAHDCGDDGVSHHEGCTGTIRGGEFYGCEKAGVASPTYGSTIDVVDVYTHDNVQFGILARSDASHNISQGQIIGCVVKNNGTADIQLQKAALVGWDNSYDTLVVYDDSVSVFDEKTTENLDTTLTHAGQAADAKAAGDAVNELKSALDASIENPLVVSPLVGKLSAYGNLWDESNLKYGYFQSGTGKIVGTNATTAKYSPTYIPVTPGDLIIYNTTRPYICAYDADGQVVECVQGAWTGYTIPSGAAYIRLSALTTAISGLQVFVSGTSRTEREQPIQLYAKNLRTGKPVIYVSKTGDYGDYSSLTEALYTTYDEAPDVIVRDGTYDIVAEYKALFGADIFDTMTWQTTEMNNFQWGIYINNRKVTFLTGTSVVCDMTGYVNDSTRRFSPFNLGRDAEIDGLICTAVNPYYIIHDDFGDNNDIPFTNRIVNCVLLCPGSGPTQNNVIGGGTRKFSTKIVENCYLHNGDTRITAMRYHNVALAGAKPVVIIKNVFANHKIKVNCYGTQTTKMTAIINNCQASAIEKGFEGDASVDNVDLFAWCNVETGA